MAFRSIGPLSQRPLLQCRIVSLATIHQSRRVLHDAVLSQYCDIQSVSLSIPSCLLFFSRVTHLSIHKVLHAHYCVEHMLLPVAYACDAICMQDWLEQIAFVCFVSLPPRGRGRMGEAEKEKRGRAREEERLEDKRPTKRRERGGTM